MKRSRVRSLAVGIAFAFGAASAFAGGNLNRFLEGEYTYSGPGSCVSSLAGFHPTNFTALGPASVTSFNVNGTIVFRGDGTATMTARSVSVFGAGASAVEFTGEVSYELASDMTITLEHGPSYSTTVVPNTGAQSVVAGSAVMTGRVSDDLRTIVVMNNAPAVETVSTLEGTVLSRRLCTRERTFVKLHHGKK